MGALEVGQAVRRGGDVRVYEGQEEGGRSWCWGVDPGDSMSGTGSGPQSFDLRNFRGASVIGSPACWANGRIQGIWEALKINHAGNLRELDEGVGDLLGEWSDVEPVPGDWISTTKLSRGVKYG